MYPLLMYFMFPDKCFWCIGVFDAETLREKCLNMDFFLVRIFLYSDHKNSVFGHFSCSENN